MASGFLFSGLFLHILLEFSTSSSTLISHDISSLGLYSIAKLLETFFSHNLRPSTSCCEQYAYTHTTFTTKETGERRHQ